MAVSGCAKAIARVNITVPENKPGISRVVCIKANPVVLSAELGTDRVMMEGVMMYTVCYFSPDGMQSYSGSAPFEAEAQLEGLTAGRM